MFALGAQLGLVPPAKAEPEGCGRVGVVQAVERHDATCGAHGEIGRIVNEPADLDQVVEDGGIDWAWAGGVVVDVDEGLEDLVGKLQPWPMKRRDVAPVSAVSIDQRLGRAHRELRVACVEVSREGTRRARNAIIAGVATAGDGQQREGTTDLLRQMIRAGDAGGWGGAGATGLDLEEEEEVLVLVLVFMVVTRSFLEEGLEEEAAPSKAGPTRGPTTPPPGLALPPSGVSFLCLFFFLAIVKDRLKQELEIRVGRWGRRPRRRGQR